MFKPAKQQHSHQRIALVGPTGSGKSYSALSLATASWDRVALLSLEDNSPQVAWDGPVYDRCSAIDLAGLIALIRLAEVEKYPAVIIDCLSSLWTGPRGLMRLVDQHQSRGWGMVDTELARLYAAIHAFPGHVLATFRAEEVRLVTERDGQHRIVSQVGKVGFKPDFGAQFDVILELSGAVADCKKGPPSVYGKLWPQPGAELAALLLPSISGSQVSQPAPEATIPPQEAAPETPAHPLGSGTSTPPSAPNPTGQNEETEMLEVVHGLREFAKEAARSGVGVDLIRKVWADNEGRLNAKGQLVGMSKENWAGARDDIEELIRKAKAEAETPWESGVRL